MSSLSIAPAENWLLPPEPNAGSAKARLTKIHADCVHSFRVRGNPDVKIGDTVVALNICRHVEIENNHVIDARPIDLIEPE
jgi:hypothetical protein